MKVNLDNNNPAFGRMIVHPGVPIGPTYWTNLSVLNLSDKYIRSVAKGVDVHIFLKNVRNKGFDVIVCDAGASPKGKNYDSSGTVRVKREIRLGDIAPRFMPDSLNETVTDAIRGFCGLKRMDHWLVDFMNEEKEPCSQVEDLI